MARIEFDETQMVGAGGGKEAMYNLGMMYCIGRDVEIDLVSAHKWLNLAALRGSEDAKAIRSEISAEMTAEQIAEAQRQARSWLQLH